MQKNIADVHNKRLALALMNHLQKVNDGLPPVRAEVTSKPPPDWLSVILVLIVIGLLLHSCLKGQ